MILTPKLKVEWPVLSETEILAAIGPYLNAVEPALQPMLEKLLTQYPDINEDYETMMKHKIRVPAPYYIWMCSAVSYMAVRYRLLKGEANGTTEQPN